MENFWKLQAFWVLHLIDIRLYTISRVVCPLKRKTCFRLHDNVLTGKCLFKETLDSFITAILHETSFYNWDLQRILKKFYFKTSTITLFCIFSYLALTLATAFSWSSNTHTFVISRYSTFLVCLLLFIFYHEVNLFKNIIKLISSNI